MATTDFTVFGYLGYEVVIDGSVETNVLFGLVDEKQSPPLLAWYAFRTAPAPWHSLQFDAYQDPHGPAENHYKEPTDNDNFGTADLPGTGFEYPDQLSVAGLVRKIPGSNVAAFAELNFVKPLAGLTRCILSVPNVQPVSAVLAINLVTQRKRRTLDLTKPGILALIEIVRFSPDALLAGPNLPSLRHQGFRNHVVPLIHEQMHR